MHNGDIVVQFSGNEEVFRTFKNRITLNRRTAELHLRGLRPEDSGLYELEVYAKKTSHSYTYNLQVIDKVGKPTITCETNTSDSSGVSGLLTCSAAQPEVEYMWVFDGNTQPGPQLRIFLGSKADEQVYSCRVSNPLSNQTATFTAQDCYSGEGSSALVVLSIVLSLLLLLLLASVAALVIYRRCYKGGRRGSVEGYTPLRPLQEGEGEAQDETPKKGHVQRMKRRLERGRAQQTPVKDHRSRHGHVQEMKRRFELGRELQTPVKDHRSRHGADDHREELQTSPCSPAQDEQAASLDESVLPSSGHEDDGDQPRQSTPLPQLPGGSRPPEEENSENSKVSFQNLSPQSPNHGKKSGADVKGADLASEPTGAKQKLSVNEPDPAEMEQSVLKPSTEEPGADDHREELQTSPCSPAQDEQAASLDESVLTSSGHEDGDQPRQSTPEPGGSQPPEGENSDSHNDDGQFNPPPACSPIQSCPISANMASKNAAGDTGEVSSNQLTEDSDTRFEDAVESGINSHFVTCEESGLDSSQSEGEKETRPPASSGETEQDKQNSSDGDKNRKGFMNA